MLLYRGRENNDGTEQVFTEWAAAHFNALEQTTHVNYNYPFGDLEPDIYEENLRNCAWFTKISM